MTTKNNISFNLWYFPYWMIIWLCEISDWWLVLCAHKTNIASIAKRERTTHGQRHKDSLCTLVNMCSTYTANFREELPLRSQLCLPLLPVKQPLMLRILLFTVQLSVVQWNTGGVTMICLINHFDLIESWGGTLSLFDTGQKRAEVDREKVKRSGSNNNIDHLGWTKIKSTADSSVQ